jgi:hypothetical protein
MAMTRRLLAAIGATALLACVATEARAVPVDTELMLLLDGSGSISNANFNLQRDAYVSTLNSLLPTDGRVTIGVWVFGGDQAQVFAPTNIASATDKTNLLNAISGLNATTRAGIDTGSTAIGDAINVAFAAFTTNLLDAAIRQLIDVSTDGGNNAGVDDVTAAANAVAGGVEQVNCVGIGGAANCGFIAGTGSFSLNAGDFTAFQTSLDTKLRTELNIPEPATLGVLAIGLIALGATRFRRTTIV